MTAKQDPNAGLSYGWELGEDGWNTGMDANLQLLGATMFLQVSGIANAPTLTANGTRYIVGAAPTGAFASQANKVAVMVEAAWKFFTPKAGWLAWVETTATQWHFDGTAWGNVAASNTDMTATTPSSSLLTTVAGVRALLDSIGAGSTYLTAATAMNSVVNNVPFSWSATTTNLPLAGSTGRGINIASDANNITQFAIVDGTRAIYIRYCASGTWGSWTLANVVPANLFSEFSAFSGTNKKIATDVLNAMSNYPVAVDSAVTSFDSDVITAKHQIYSISNAMTDHPTTPGTADAGILFNMRRAFNAGAALVQIFISSAGIIYWRVGSGGPGAWTWRLAANTTLNAGWRAMYDSANPSPTPTSAQVGAVAGPVTALGTLDINTLGMALGAPGTTIYYQSANASATPARNYPEAKAGTLFVSGSAYGVQQMYITFDTGNIWTRGLTGTWNGTNGPWRPWIMVAGTPATQTEAIAGLDGSKSITSLTLKQVLDNFGLASTYLNAVADLNTALLNQSFQWSNTSTNTPIAASYGRGFTIASSATDLTQFGIINATGQTFIRYMTGGVWGAWMDPDTMHAEPYAVQSNPGTTPFPAAAYTAIPFYTSGELTGGITVTSNTNFTVPVAGLYQFELEVRMNGGATNMPAVGTNICLSIDGVTVPTGLRAGYSVAEGVRALSVARLVCTERLAAGAVRKAYLLNQGAAAYQVAAATLKITRLSA